MGEINWAPMKLNFDCTLQEATTQLDDVWYCLITKLMIQSTAGYRVGWLIGKKGQGQISYGWADSVEHAKETITKKWPELVAEGF